MSIHPVAITNRKKVETKLAEHVWYQDVLVLVLFVRIARLVTNRCGKSKFRDAVKSVRCNFYFGRGYL